MAGLIAGAALAGCAHRTACCPATHAAGSPAAVSPSLVPTARGTLAPNLAELTSYEAVEQVLGKPPVAAVYHSLDAPQCQCLAAGNCALANVLTEESSLASQTPEGRRCADQRSADVRSQLLAYRAVEERNRAAARALEAFYLLAEAEAGRDLLKRSLAEIDQAIDDFGQIEGRGIRMEADKGALQRQRMELVSRQMEVDRSIGRLNGTLRQFLGLSADDAAAILPAADLTVTLAAIDVDKAVAEGLAQRADVCMLEMLAANLDEDTLPAVRGALGLMEGSLAAGGGKLGLLRTLRGREDKSAEVSTRATQIDRLLVDRRRTATEEIRQAAADVENRLRLAALACDRLQSWRKRIVDLRQRRAADGVTAFDLHAAQLELIRAETQVVHEVVAWRIDQVKLREAQGALAPECGYGLPSRCN